MTIRIRDRAVPSQPGARAFDYLVFIGRFEPFHLGHFAVVERALELADEVILLIGSANKPRTIRNPWTSPEREMMIRATFANDNERLLIRPLRDHLYNDALWVKDVQRIVSDITGSGPGKKIGLIGHIKDQSSYYLEMFPQWQLVPVANRAGISATDLRDYLFSDAPDVGKDLLIRAAVPEPVFAMLKDFRDGPQFSPLLREYQFIESYQQSWSTAPYPPTFVTVDAVVIHSGHVLLVRRRSEPGKGLWALPGGFLRQDEPLKTAVVRELREETQLPLSASTLIGSIKAREVFDHPERSLRGRTLTHAFLFEFPTGELPPVKGSDDAEHAQWIPISLAIGFEEHFFEDHFHILEHFIGGA